MKKIILICNTGMSTAMMAKKMNEAGAGEFYVEAHGEAEYIDFIDGCDLILVAPQIRHLIPSIKEEVPSIPVKSINPTYYGLMNAKAVFEDVKKILY